ncbi:MAG: hypothetical protein EA388_13340 [Nitriliruptor sp.]|nr:MAG: hypothetical protein EA388_13340 [Nitriliruptor sp.]
MRARHPLHPSARGLVVIVAATAALLAGCSEADGQGDADGTPDGSGDTTSGDADDGDGGFSFDGPGQGALINAEGLGTLTFTVTASDDPDALDDLLVLLDGDDVTTAADRSDGTLTYAPDALDDGERTVVVADGSSVTDDDATGEPEHLHTWSFDVKAEPPAVELTAPDGPILANTTVTVAGNTEPEATVDIGDTTTTADQDGSFEVELDGVDGDLTILVTDVAGNTTELTESFAVVASRVEIDEVRTVHATFWAWATPSLREPIIEMIDDGRINSVQLDLKDEGGHIGYASEVPLAQEIGADIGPLDLEQAVADLHDRDVAVIGRIVAFADPALASWAWENDRRDMVIQDNDGNDFYRGSYAGFSNYTHEDVIAYNLDLAEEAAKAGVDHILWDYIRRPEGMDNYTVPGLTTTPEEAIVEFTRLADERLAPYGIQHGASVYGIAADRPQQIGQDIPAMSEHLDYVAPMLYPSHWGPGEYGVSDPNRQPYDIIRATLEVWDEATEGTRARVVPWFEDTPYRAWDRPFQIREQIRAAKDHGIDEWLMWNPGSTFTPSAYERRE